MKYQTVDPNDIAPNPWNANVVSDEMKDKLRASLQRFGVFKPALVRELEDGSLQSIGGWHRTEQAAELGMEEIPVINLGVISDERAKEISLADNARYGVDDADKLAAMLESLDVDVILETLPFDNEAIENITRSLAVNIDDLDLDGVDDDLEDDELEDEDEEEKPERTVRDHQILRFKVSLGDAPKIQRLITQTMRDHGYTSADDLTNAGDALTHILLGSDTDDA